ncbi:MAG: hypothetical protein MR581_01835, partial [Lachnospiraceae bacterium]|nr:hypothetical protein [Lachnospiraceae bacterium]
HLINSSSFFKNCNNVIIQHPQKTDEIRTESLLAERFQKFSEGRTSGEAALTARNEERKAL